MKILNIKTITWVAFFCIPSVICALDPAKITCTNYRGEAVSAASPDTFYWGEKIHWTNCVVMAGGTNTSTREDLTGVTILLTWGNDIFSGTTVTGNITSATAGVWNASTTLRSQEGVTTYFELRLTNSAESFVYPFKTITTRGRR